MRKLNINILQAFIILFTISVFFSSCSEDINDNMSDVLIEKSNDDLIRFNDALNEISSINNINNKIEFVEILDANINPLSTMKALDQYNIQYTTSVSINFDDSHGGILHVGVLDENHILVAHELPSGNLNDLIEINVFENESSIWYSQVTSIFSSDLQIRNKTTREECEKETTELVMVGTAFLGFTSWWCPPCLAAGSVATGMVALGYLSCRFYD